MAYLSATTYPSATTYLGLIQPRAFSYDSNPTSTYNAQPNWTYTPVTG